MPAAGYLVPAHGIGSAVEALGQGFHHGGVAVALLRGLDIERGGAAVWPLGIAAHEGVALEAALELLDVNLEYGQAVAAAVGHEARRQGAVGNTDRRTNQRRGLFPFTRQLSAPCGLGSPYPFPALSATCRQLGVNLHICVFR